MVVQRHYVRVWYSVCNKTIEVSSPGSSALTDHAKREKGGGTVK